MLPSSAYQAQFEAYNTAFFLLLPHAHVAGAACDTLRLKAEEANKNYLKAFTAECDALHDHGPLPTLTDEEAPRYQVVGEVFYLSPIEE